MDEGPRCPVAGRIGAATGAPLTTSIDLRTPGTRQRR
jgi:hypothetical protein